jgi:hypothetical protein
MKYNNYMRDTFDNAVQPELSMRDTFDNAVQPELSMRDTFDNAVQPELSMRDTFDNAVQPELSIIVWTGMYMYVSYVLDSIGDGTEISYQLMMVLHSMINPDGLLISN